MNPLKFAKNPNLKKQNLQRWKVLIVDDDPDVHVITKTVLKNFTYEHKSLELLSSYDAPQTLEALKTHPDIALILLDVVMEQDDTGLRLVKTIRKELHNHMVRIVLRTGQPGFAPETDVIVNYDIDDYKEKTELTSQKLYTTVITALRTVNNMQKVQHSKMQTLSEMISNIAHQWRQPLSVISTTTGNIKVKSDLNLLDKKTIDDFCATIEHSTEYLSKTINDFREFAKGDKEKTLFNLTKEIEECLKLERSVANNVDFVKQLNNDIMLYNYANELLQVLVNIINNAIDALDQNAIQEPMIFLTTYRDKHNAYIKIFDNAGGISPEILPKVFEPYYTTKHQSRGTGLGLYIVHKIVTESLNGQIRAQTINYVHNEKRFQGAEFKITLPMTSF